jgi:hypothetical protein
MPADQIPAEIGQNITEFRPWPEQVEFGQNSRDLARSGRVWPESCHFSQIGPNLLTGFQQHLPNSDFRISYFFVRTKRQKKILKNFLENHFF